MPRRAASPITPPRRSASPGAPPRRSHQMLEWSVTPDTVRRYREQVMKFLQWCYDNDEDAETEEELDDVLLEYVWNLYEQGAGKTAARHVLYGIVMYLPQLKYSLFKTRRALKGWDKRSPSESYPPMTWELAQLVAIHLRHSGNFRDGHRMSIAVLLAFDCLLRIGELLNLRREDVADSGDGRIGAEHRGLILRLRQTKTGPNKDCTVEDPVVVALLRELVRTSRPGSYLFPFLKSTFRARFKRACAQLRLSPDYVVHSLRHGGATRYRHVLGWSIEDVMARGRWASSKSTRRYIQSLRAMALAQEVPPHITKLALQFAKDLELYMTLPQKH